MNGEVNGERYILYVDLSEESKTIRRWLTDMGTNFRVVFSDAPKRDTPAIEGRFGIVRGFETIQRLFSTLG